MTSYLKLTYHTALLTYAGRAFFLPHPMSFSGIVNVVTSFGSSASSASFEGKEKLVCSDQTT